MAAVTDEELAVEVKLALYEFAQRVVIMTRTKSMERQCIEGR